MKIPTLPDPHNLNYWSHNLYNPPGVQDDDLAVALWRLAGRPNPYASPYLISFHSINHPAFIP